MRFCDKLPKLRKANNLSQEQLADRLGISRQAVSKWESGASVPDMDKMMQICGVLNCTLDDLLDDGVIDTKKEWTNKNNLNNYFHDFLKYITRVYNMFYSMVFKEKIKCILEMGIIFLILWSALAIVYYFTDNYMLNLLRELPRIGNYLHFLFSNVLIIGLIILGIIIFLHLFKIRYLDYFITIEDKNVIKKTIEEPIEKQENKYYIASEKEKVIIRDPKHSSVSFFDLLLKIIMAFIKFATAFIALFFILAFLFGIIASFILIYHLSYGIIFLFALMITISATTITYLGMELLLKFIFSKKQKTKRLFIMFIISLIICGSGMGLMFSNILNFKIINNSDYKTEIISIPMEDNLIIKDYTYQLATNFVIDNTLSDIKIEIKYPNNFEYEIYDQNSYDYHHYYIYISALYPETYKFILEDLKKNQIRNYSGFNEGEMIIYLSEENYQKVKENYKRYYEIQNNYCNCDDYYTENDININGDLE